MPGVLAARVRCITKKEGVGWGWAGWVGVCITKTEGAFAARVRCITKKGWGGGDTTDMATTAREQPQASHPQPNREQRLPGIDEMQTTKMQAHSILATEKEDGD